MANPGIDKDSRDYPADQKIEIRNGFTGEAERSPTYRYTGQSPE
jgi:hypothetical protein